MQVRFDFDTDMMEHDRLKEKLHELKSIEGMIRSNWSMAREKDRRRIQTEFEERVLRNAVPDYF